MLLLFLLLLLLLMTMILILLLVFSLFSVSKEYRETIFHLHHLPSSSRLAEEVLVLRRGDVSSRRRRTHVSPEEGVPGQPLLDLRHPVGGRVDVDKVGGPGRGQCPRARANVHHAQLHIRRKIVTLPALLRKRFPPTFAQPFPQQYTVCAQETGCEFCSPRPSFSVWGSPQFLEGSLLSLSLPPFGTAESCTHPRPHPKQLQAYMGGPTVSSRIFSSCKANNFT